MAVRERGVEREREFECRDEKERGKECYYRNMKEIAHDKRGKF